MPLLKTQTSYRIETCFIFLTEKHKHLCICLQPVSKRVPFDWKRMLDTTSLNFSSAVMKLFKRFKKNLYCRNPLHFVSLSQAPVPFLTLVDALLL